MQRTYLGQTSGPYKGKLQEKSSRAVTTIHELPNEIIEKHGSVTLEVDIMYVNEIPFVITTLHSIHFCTAELIKNEKSMTIATVIQHVLLIFK